MKITITNSKLIPFEEIAEGTVFRVPNFEDHYYIKTASVFDENTGEEDLNCLLLEKYTFDCFGPKYLVYPVYNAELIIS